MIRYTFTGHLHPRPKGTEHAMCGLSGEVYLAADVDAELARMRKGWLTDTSRLSARAAAAESKVAEYKRKLRELRKAHGPTVNPQA